VEGQSYAELAEIIGIPVGTLRSRIFAAREALRQISCSRRPNQGGRMTCNDAAEYLSALSDGEVIPPPAARHIGKETRRMIESIFQLKWWCAVIRRPKTLDP
jgi:hypothetical protein